ncbi:MAG TPA: Clp protease N-terminal domain-containing protein [Acidimicrobiales bacterium]|jgi:Clp amino terminal domain, pathogenicity island component|nr:Clp protease N-terminal domain-containing protein [Acidimicrobiales bacterium]
MDLDELIAAVEETGTDGPLDRVSAAAAVKDQIEALGDELLDHFVKEARDQGRSWTQIGDALGVTRQAAQQRHGGLIARLVQGLTEGRFKRFTKRARAAVIAAQTAARDRRHEWIGTEHLLLGLVANDDGNVAETALARLGVDRATVVRLVDELVPAGTEPVSGHISFTPRAKKTLEVALREALRLGHNYIGCEHIVLALRRVDQGLAARVLAEQGVSYKDLERSVRDVLGDEDAGS